MRVAMHSQKIQVKGRDPAHRRLDRGADVEQFHIQKDALALILFQLVGQRQTTACQHPQTDLVETDAVAKRRCEFQTGHDIGHIHRNNQAVIGHLGYPCLFVAV